MSTAREVAGSWRVAVRAARRSAYRSPLRTLLIVFMLALPVFAGTVLALAYTGTYASADTEASWRLGRADHQIGGADRERVLATLPAGARTADVTNGRTVLKAAGGYRLVDYVAADVTDPVAHGMYVLRAGRAPVGPAEVAVTARLAALHDVRLGERVEVGLRPSARTVVGVVDIARQLSLVAVLSAADQPLSAGGPTTLVMLPPGADWTPRSDRAMVCEPIGDGGQSCVSSFSSLSRVDARPGAAEQATRAAAFLLVVGFAGTQVALLAGAAFAVGARRQRRELAMVAAAGAGPRQVARMVLANGLLLGALAGGAGVALGVLVYRLNRDRVERIADHPLTAGPAPVAWLTGIALFAVLVGLLAAYGPARLAARQPIRAALADREPPARQRNLRWLLGGLLVAAAGAAAAVLAAGPTGSIMTVTAGTVAILLGIAALAPVAVAAVGRVAGRLPLAPRLAARHATRHRLRTAASAAAVCTAVAGSMALMLFYAAESTENYMIQPPARTGQLLVPAQAADRLTPADLRAAERAVPLRESVPLTVLTEPALVDLDRAPTYRNTGLPAYPSERVAVGGAAVIRVVTGAEPPPEAVRALRTGAAVVFYPPLLVDGALRVGAAARIPAVLVPAPDYYTDLPGAVVPERTAARHGLAAGPGGAVLDLSRPPTPAEVDAVNSAVLAAQVEAADAGRAEPAQVTVGAEPLERRRDRDAMFLVLAAVSAVVTLAASAVAVGLANTELRTDLATLAAVGAGPRVRRWLAAAQAGLIAGIGTVLGVAAGIAPAAGMVAFRGDLEWRLPWLPLVLTVLVAPLLAVAATAVSTRPRLVLLRRPG